MNAHRTNSKHIDNSFKEILDALQKETFESNGLKEFVSANTSNILPVILMSARFATF